MSILISSNLETVLNLRWVQAVFSEIDSSHNYLGLKFVYLVAMLGLEQCNFLI
jgi:hypothetical protein